MVSKSTTTSKSNLDFVINSFKSKKDYKNISTHNFKVIGDVFFQDMVWDFNFLNTNNRSKESYKFDFNTVPNNYVFFAKHIVLNEYFFAKNSFSTCHKSFILIRLFFKNLFKTKTSDVYLINKKVVVEFISSYEKNVSVNRVENMCVTLVKFFKLLSDILQFNYEHIIQFLDNKGKECRCFTKLHSAKNEYIPDSFLNQTISLAIKDIDNDNLKLSNRIVACMLVIIAETGMRAEEATLLESNMLDTIYIDSLDKEVNYLKFKTFKTTDNIGEYKLTYTWLTPIATKAYKTCQSLMFDCIDTLGEISKLRLLIILSGHEKKLYKNIRLSKLRKLVEDLTKDELQDAVSKSKKYLFIDGRTGIQKRGSHLIRDNILSFFIRHTNDFNLDIIPKSQLKNLNTFMFTNESKFIKEFSTSERKLLKYSDLKNKKYFFVNPHMFRVTVCTKLFLQNVHIDFIVKHMNHLSEDMTLYYNKSSELKDNLAESIKILSLMSHNSGGLIETNINAIQSETYKSILSDDLIRENINKINQFLSMNNLNIVTDIDKILKKLIKFSSPIIENEFGVCINVVTQSICAKREFFSSELGSYILNITLPTYKNISYSYDIFNQKIKILEHNKKIADKNSAFYNEYKREFNSLCYFVETKLEKEIKLLEYDLNNFGYDYVLKMYPDLESIIQNIEFIQEEINLWTK